jgi:hypothetical protein
LSQLREPISISLKKYNSKQFLIFTALSITPAIGFVAGLICAMGVFICNSQIEFMKEKGCPLLLDFAPKALKEK